MTEEQERKLKEYVKELARQHNALELRVEALERVTTVHVVGTVTSPYVLKPETAQ